MNRCEWIFVLLLSLAMSGSGQPLRWHGTWAANLGNGATVFQGVWSAVPGEAPDTMIGSWSLRDQNGTELAAGTWAAGKGAKVWRGTWQARRSSGQVYDGTWSAPVELPASSHLSDLFEAAIAKSLSGAWRMGAYAGAWTIRSAKRE